MDIRHSVGRNTNASFQHRQRISRSGVTRIERGSIRRATLASILLVSLLWLPEGSLGVAQPETKQVQLHQGWNYVALTVRPDVTALDALFGPVIDRVVMIKDVAGNTFVPSFGINTIGDWDLKQAYMVNMSAAASLSITGEPMTASDVAISLSPGWNLVPFYGGSVTEIAEVLHDLGEDLVLAKDEDGRVYYPTLGINDIGALTAGAGYQINVSRAVTLVYRGENDDLPPGTDPSHVVNTIADAVALRGLRVGDRVRVRGYHSAGDGGGGDFVVTDDGCETDGGTCFVPTEHTQAASSGWGQDRTLNRTVVYGSVRVYYTQNNFLESHELHGHRLSYYSARREPILDHASGVFRNESPGRLAQAMKGNRDTRIDYRFATSSRRLVRDHRQEEIRLSWFGVKPADPSNVFDATDHVASALNAAGRRAAQQRRVVDLVFDEMYYYLGVIEIPNNVRLRGARSGEMNGQGLRVPPNMAGRPWQERLPSSSSLHLPRSARSYLQDETHILIRPQHVAEFISIRDLELDGGLQSNRYVFERKHDLGESTNSSYPTEVDHLLQNSYIWVGLAVDAQHPIYNHVLLQNVHFHSYGGNVIVTEGTAYFDGSRDVRLGSSARNRQVYDMRTKSGTVENMTIYGSAFGAPLVTYGGHYVNLRFEDLIQVSVGGMELDYPINQRIRDGGHYDHFPKQLTIDGLYMDLRGTRITAALFLSMDSVLVRNAVIHTPETGSFTLDYIRAQHGMPLRGVVIDNVTIYRHSRTTNNLVNPWSAYYQDFVVSNVRTVEMASSPSGGDELLGIRPSQNARDRQRATFTNITYDRPFRHGLIITDVINGAPGMDAIFDDVSVNNTAELVTKGGSTNRDGTRLYWRNCSFNVHNSFSSDLDLSYFQNCSDRLTGRRSEDSGTITITASGGETHVEISTNLFWRPQHVQYQNGIVTSVSVVGNDNRNPRLRFNFNRTLTRGDQIVIPWNAAVRPFPNAI